MSGTNSSHVLLVPMLALGHTRPMCVLAARLVSERENILVTFLASPNTYSMVISEIARQFPTVNDTRFQRIRVASLFHSNELDPFKLLEPFNASYTSFYQSLSAGEPVTCAISGTTFAVAPAPRTVILDFFAITLMNITRSITGHAIPVIAWISANASTCIRIFGPESLGGLGDFYARAEAEAERTGEYVEEVAAVIYKSTKGAIVKVPGIPDMYDYEYFPQDLVFKTSLVPVLKSTHRFLNECDGALVTSINGYDNEGMDALRKWFNDQGSRKVYAVGPLTPDPSSESDVGNDTFGVTTFLKNTLDRYGKRSLVYVSFGSVFWPASTDYLEEVIEALIEKNFPFILCAASPFASLSEVLVAKIEHSCLGMVTKWAPQQYILSHQATGWFVSHCGHGSVTESLQNGIPLICWPFEADQPDAAAHLTQDLKAGFEPIEVKSFVGRPMYRSGKVPQGSRRAVGIEFREILEACRGDEGAAVRRNAEVMKIQFTAAWKENGTAKKELSAFLNSYL